MALSVGFSPGGFHSYPWSPSLSCCPGAAVVSSLRVSLFPFSIGTQECHLVPLPSVTTPWSGGQGAGQCSVRARLSDLKPSALPPPPSPSAALPLVQPCNPHRRGCFMAPCPSSAGVVLSTPATLAFSPQREHTKLQFASGLHTCFTASPVSACAASWDHRLPSFPSERDHRIITCQITSSTGAGFCLCSPFSLQQCRAHAEHPINTCRGNKF